MTIHAIFKNGVFRPTEPVNLPDDSEVALEASLIGPDLQNHAREEQARSEIFQILSRSYDTGQTDTAARHNEHQP